jgi:hypothetical protein
VIEYEDMLIHSFIRLLVHSSARTFICSFSHILFFAANLHRIAMIVAVSDYRKSCGWSDLPNAVLSANQVQERIQQADMGFVPPAGAVLHDHRATRASIYKALKLAIDEALTHSDSLLLLYFCGHGVEIGARPYFVAHHQLQEGDSPNVCNR